MNKPTSPVILAIGAHVGDMELTAGGLLSTCAMQNWTPVIISLTTTADFNNPLSKHTQRSYGLPYYC